MQIFHPPLRPRVGLLGKFAIASLVPIVLLGFVLAQILRAEIRQRAGSGRGRSRGARSEPSSRSRTCRGGRPAAAVAGGRFAWTSPELITVGTIGPRLNPSSERGLRCRCGWIVPTCGVSKLSSRGEKSGFAGGTQVLKPHRTHRGASRLPDVCDVHRAAVLTSAAA